MNAKDEMYIGIVVIARNEGQRLVSCFQSLAPRQYPIVYVDSGSSDGSPQLAKNFGVDVIALDGSIPFSAARARNVGLQRILIVNPAIKYVQFLDGDCALCGGWLEAAVDALEKDESLAAVFGSIEEINCGNSIYNRLCALEWQSPPGRIQNCGAFGGNSMVRAKAFTDVGGFNPQVIAGEDAEIAARMLLADYRIEKLDLAMVRHDANIMRFTQWWRRSIRSGHAIGQRAQMHGHSILRDCMRERTSVMIWGMVMPLLVVATSLISARIGTSVGTLYGVLTLRIWWHRQRRGNTAIDAATYAVFTVLGKFPEAIGLMRFWKSQLLDQYHIIEYK